jgi:NAD(P)-dependent dehydrogenase (short-subunit alcohol dehydrogenase family)
MLDLKDKVVVITGASSGLGRAAALQFARQGSVVVLAGRRGTALEDAAHQCRALGARAVSCRTDVTEEEQVRSLANEALKLTGSLDVWVNNAGVTCIAPLDSESFDEHRRVLETNLYGAIFGARCALPIFRRQGRGTLINVGSVLSKIGQPFVPSYVISKFGLQGLTETLRAAAANTPNIHICSLLPYAMDTEHFESSANQIGRSAHPMSPLQSPEKVARALVDLARRPRRQRLVPRLAGLGLALHFLLPRATERVLQDVLCKWHLGDEQPATAGNVYAPVRATGAVHGERAVRVATPKLLLYAAGRFLGLPFEAAFERLRSARVVPARNRDAAL